MSDYRELDNLIKNAKSIVVLQADNPDGDSLGSSLALEAILSDMGKTVHMVCAVDVPSYLRYLKGWDRVQKEIPRSFDLTIIVDSSSESLFENFEAGSSFSWIKSKPVVVIDHHAETKGISYADVSIVEKAVATSELIYRIAGQLGWPLPVDACEVMVIAILSDSLGLTTDATSSDSLRTVADLVDKGVSLAKIDNERRATMRKDPSLIPYKGKLLQRVEFSNNGRLATVIVPWEEIEKYSPLYNPTMLVIEDMRMTIGVDIAVAYKIYKDGKITAKIRSNFGKPIAGKLAATFGGGGHDYAAGFKITDGTKLEKLQHDVHAKVAELLDSLKDK